MCGSIYKTIKQVQPDRTALTCSTTSNRKDTIPEIKHCCSDWLTTLVFCIHQERNAFRTNPKHCRAIREQFYLVRKYSSRWCDPLEFTYSLRSCQDQTKAIHLTGASEAATFCQDPTCTDVHQTVRLLCLQDHREAVHSHANISQTTPPCGRKTVLHYYNSQRENCWLSIL